MNEQNLSQWFDLAEQKPWEVGVYEVDGDTLAGRRSSEDGDFLAAYFDGIDFGFIACVSPGSGTFSIQSAKDNFTSGSYNTNIQRWRGLSINPEVKKKPQNKRKTMYVVIDRGGVVDTPVAAFFDAKNAQEYSERLAYPRIKKIRFRTPE